MSKIRRDIFIEILKYADSHQEFTCFELFKDLKLNQAEKDLVAKNLGNKLLFYNTGRLKTTKKHGKVNIFRISIEGKFQLLEYQELQEARQSAQQAKKDANLAIIIAIATFIVGTLIQIYTPLHIDSEQLKLLRSSSVTHKKLETIVINQEELIDTIKSSDSILECYNH